MGEVAGGSSRSLWCCSKGRPRPACRSCASCTGSSRPIRPPKRTSRASSTRRPGGGSSPGELWRYTSPYRGLEAMEEKDSDYFFGRKRETVEVLDALAGAPDRLPVLIGNSGVGKSSLAQAGVLAALKRQAWPEEAGAPNAWPAVFQDSRQWCFLTLKPGTEPIKALVESLPRHLAIRRDRSRAGEAAAWLDRAVARARRRCPT